MTMFALRSQRCHKNGLSGEAGGMGVGKVATGKFWRRGVGATQETYSWTLGPSSEKTPINLGGIEEIGHCTRQSGSPLCCHMRSCLTAKKPS